ncbi:hypothetical protein BABINDRAFT_172934 [Babjeviella inositovora NRRL Y-12698]|uniref:Major facilitator superfamily (MFS) profile domain-containing protein n=1 Tax=Babjeviella inositovora NRRL Y-12698 TaxID=984486 RepID=A0A1E3QHI6_9ASCO|nr:uncharacterized protein BABINDRAFT_172934 [Babjeviella inositovora NRRL Y-12698]ODQ77173.1 hypothetical protein BABINDRAFT_172934 [Babjeviella inositovora NRRL Y-12698]
MAAVLRKIDFRVLPFIFICYMFFYIDKTTLSYAAIFGIKKDLNLKGTEYSWLSSVFYFGYMAWSFPTNYLLIRFPVGKYLGVNIFMWGAFLMIQAACSDFSSLAAVRAFGGAAEACADSAFMLITGMWYTKREQPIRIGLWYAANGMGVAFGGLLGYGIGSIKGSMPSWKYEFLIVGCLCCTWGVVIFFGLPDSPLRNQIFSAREKQLLIIRLKENQSGVDESTDKVLKWDQVKDAFLDPKLWLLFIITMFANIPNGGISNFGTMIIQGFGFSTLVTTLLQIPNGFIISFSILVCVYLNDLWMEKSGKNRRTIMIILFMLPNIAGGFGLLLVNEHHKVGRLICYYLTGPYNAAFVMFLSLNTSNTAGTTKKSVTNCMLFLGYCVGNIAGPFFYKTSQYPKYKLGMGSLLFSHFMEAILAATLGLYLRRENMKRDKAQGVEAGAELSTEFAYEDLTDRQNPNFRYVY